MKIYIAGKITGLPKQQYIAKFTTAEIELTAAGHVTVNPCRLGIPDEATLEQALLVCLTHLRQCDAIYLLPCWQQSPGAVIERQYAIDHGLEIMYADHETALIHQIA